VTFWFDLGGAAGVISLEEMKIMVVGYQERLMVKLVVVLERLWINGLLVYVRRKRDNQEYFGY
jgi:hypothetical protein